MKTRNYIGTKIGNFEVLDQKKENGKTFLYCKCTLCNREKWIFQGSVKYTKCCKSKFLTIDKLPYHISEKLKICATHYAKAMYYDEILRKYFKENHIYDDVIDDYIDLIVHKHSANEFIDKFNSRADT